MTVIAFLFHYYKHDKIFNIDTPMKMNINSIDGDSIKFNWATNKIYIKLVGSTESLDRQRIPPVDLTQRMLIIHNKI
jgi:hypothetical protein